MHGEECKLLIQVVDIDDTDQIQAQRNFNFEDADGIIAIYDINDSETWVQIEGFLYQIGIKNKEHSRKVLLIGNKLDVTRGDEEVYREVPYQMASDYAEDRNLVFGEVSFVT